MYTYYGEGSVEGVKSLQVVYRFLSIPYQEKENSRFEQAPTISQPPQIGWEIGSFFFGHTDYLIQRHSGTLAKFLKTTQDTRPRSKHPRPAKYMTGWVRVKEG